MQQLLLFYDKIFLLKVKLFDKFIHFSELVSVKWQTNVAKILKIRLKKGESVPYISKKKRKK